MSKNSSLSLLVKLELASARLQNAYGDCWRKGSKANRTYELLLRGRVAIRRKKTEIAAACYTEAVSGPLGKILTTPVKIDVTMAKVRAAQATQRSRLDVRSAAGGHDGNPCEALLSQAAGCLKRATRGKLAEIANIDAQNLFAAAIRIIEG